MKTLKIMILVMNLCPLFAAATGGMTSSGGDNKDLTWESAWFLGEEPISYCIQVGPTENVTVDKVKADFESVVRTWKSYYLARTANRDEGYYLNFNYRFENCQTSTRLKIYLGINSPEVEKAKALYQNPYSLAFRSEYDMKTAMGKGFIWFAPRGSLSTVGGFPDWSLPYTLHGMLLHEMGHVYGCGHIEGTIMKENLIPDLQMAASDDPKWAAGGKMYMTNIDHHQFLLLKTDSDLSMKGGIHPDLSGQEPLRIFELLTGRKPQGPIQAEVVKRGYQLELIYEDSVGKTSFNLNIDPQLATEFRLGGQVFRSIREMSDSSSGGFNYEPRGYAYTTVLTTQNGKSFAASVAINSNDWGRPITIKFLEGKKMTLAFFSDLWLTRGLK